MDHFHIGRNLYEVLEIDAAADPSDLRKAYRNAALRAHPDKEGGSKESFHAVSIAFEVLSCPTSRALYDIWLGRSSCPSQYQPIATHSIVVENGAETCTRTQFKRTSNHLHGEQRLHKRQRAANGSSASRTDLRMMSKVDNALDSLRSVLQSMNTLHRQTSISDMTPQVRSQLLGYMERSRQAGDISNKPAGRLVMAGHSSKTKLKTTLRDASTYEISKVYRSKASQRLKYQANIHVKALRLYTREQTSLEAAIEHQIILVQIKQALNAKSLEEQGFWEDHGKVLRECKAVLHANGTSDVELGLRAWVHIRASRWLGPRCRIASSVTTLAGALEVHARLLNAKATSWDCLRAEWIHLVRVQKRLSLEDAGIIVDRFRHTTLKEQLARALTSVERILSQEGRRVQNTSSHRLRASSKKVSH